MYVFKPTPEIIWLVLTTIVGGIAAAMATQGALPPSDWRTWAVGLAAGLVRAVLGVLLSTMNGQQPQARSRG